MFQFKNTALGIPLIFAALLAVAGCATDSTPNISPTFASVPTVSAELRTIVSVVTAKGVALSQPDFVASAPVKGNWKATVSIGKHVKAGAIVGRVSGKKVLASAAGTIVDFPAGANTRVGNGVPVVVIRYDGFGVAADFPTETAYRFYTEPTAGRASIANGVDAVDCIPAVPLSIAASSVDSPDSALSVMCLLPVNTPAVFAGMSATIGLNTGLARDVVAIPISAVSGSSGSGSVARIENKTRTVIEVGLGMTDGSWIEITSGLEVGDEIQGIAPGITESMNW